MKREIIVEINLNLATDIHQLVLDQAYIFLVVLINHKFDMTTFMNIILKIKFGLR